MDGCNQEGQTKKAFQWYSFDTVIDFVHFSPFFKEVLKSTTKSALNIQKARVLNYSIELRIVLHAPYTSRAACPVQCWSTPLTNAGAIRIQGHLTNHCSGLGMCPFQAQESQSPEVSVVSYVPCSQSELWFVAASDLCQSIRVLKEFLEYLNVLAGTLDTISEKNDMSSAHLLKFSRCTMTLFICTNTLESSYLYLLDYSIESCDHLNSHLQPEKREVILILISSPCHISSSVLAS